MTSMRDLIEAVTRHSAQYRPDFDLSHNPDQDEFLTMATGGSRVVRCLIDENGDLFAWDADHACHGDVDGVMGTENYLSFILYPRHIDSLDTDKRMLRAAISKNAMLKALGITKMRMVAGR